MPDFGLCTQNGPPGRKLKKQPPFRYSMVNAASSNLSQVPFPSYSRERRAAQKRPLRPAEVDISVSPELPARGAQIHPRTPLLPQPEGVDSATCAKLQRRACFGTRQNRTMRRAYQDEQGARPHDATTKQLPCDMAFRFAESYRALLPDVQMINSPDARSRLTRRKSTQSLRSQKSIREGLGKRRLRCAPEIVTVSQPQERPHSHTVSSDTAVESDITRVKPWAGTPCQQVPGTGESRRSTLDSTDGYKSNHAGLQICFDLLTDELCKVIFRRHPSEESYRASKLQILLMIEAYETVLANCRWELSKVEQIGDEMIHLHDEMQVLNHWLDSLYCIYGGAFSTA